MTGEEMERAIEFLLQSQANIAERQDRTDAQIQALAETQSRFIEATSASITGLAEAQARTEAKLNRLISLFEQHITVGH
jgi:hypothetical protein